VDCGLLRLVLPRDGGAWGSRTSAVAMFTKDEAKSAIYLDLAVKWKLRWAETVKQSRAGIATT
jgi:hypothetical protein